MSEEIDAILEHEKQMVKDGKLYNAPMYAMMFLALRRTCFDHGYALALHGTMGRDCDMVAIPWTEEASHEDSLVLALIKNHGLLEGSRENTDKPHGRRAYIFINYGQAGYLDFCIMPRKEAKP